MYMVEFRKMPTWKPGQYSPFIRELITMNEINIDAERRKFMEKISLIGMKYSSYGFAYDLHNEHKMVAGKFKTTLLKDKVKN